MTVLEHPVDVTLAITAARQQIAGQTLANRFVPMLEAGAIPREKLRWLAGELHRLVLSDRRSFALAASRFPAAPSGDLFLAMADGEGQALRFLMDFATALGMTEQDLRAYEPRPLAQAYPAYLTQTSLYGSRSDLALALLANVEESGGYSSRVADALQSRYGFEDQAVAHFRYFADTPQELLDQAATTLATGLSEGDDPAAAVRTARMVRAYEITFWNTLAAG
ncbi:MAG: transcriptional regulator [Kibdelosporangium sp.]